MSIQGIRNELIDTLREDKFIATDIASIVLDDRHVETGFNRRFDCRY